MSDATTSPPDPWSSPDAKTAYPKKNSVAWMELREAVAKAASIRCGDCGFCGPTLGKHRRFAWYFIIAIPVVILFGGGILGIIVVLVWLRDTKPTCAKCDSGEHLFVYDGPISDAAVALVEAAQIEDAKQFKRSQYVVAGTLFAILGGLALAFLGS